MSAAGATTVSINNPLTQNIPTGTIIEFLRGASPLTFESSLTQGSFVDNIVIVNGGSGYTSGQYFDVTVLMCENTPSGDNYAEEVKRYLDENGSIKNVSYVFVPMPKRSKIYTWLHDNGFWPAYYWGYNCWQKSVYEVARRLHKSQQFDLVYQLNMIGFREPGYLWQLPIPFVWGPMNGFHSIPLSFLKSLKGKEYFF